ncbi:CoA-substrate-specific enzyme activase [Anaerocolumna cellulosilytica]|uniref:CoA-substrate-specific enzyme activase n=1 Tax=Anaerocolumna cellulosilytica TaxID=433286 RepID=A0A6S6R6W2_9FIRM|nr:2-hydroxyacyl-CoA dehydratase [Anaerocolumna cellulosilytica]MBB5193768.1 putative CoA-substrate-specific enzyme activase [Anaerocolumna cellulosilytica]BCJ95015.1 CoA-substrate-specific enzyme activase [Anaerocolumna cellulosilytica]
MSIYRIGLDIGSTTIKIAVLNEKNQLIYSEYKRHLSDIKNTIIKVMTDCYKTLGNHPCLINTTGSGGLSVSNWLKLNFEQEVIACTKAVETLISQAEVVIELGGEDAKITYLKGSVEQRMNNSCAGGTGAFIDQMAALLNTDAAGLNEYAKNYKVLYPIASRCGVFAKTDIQPLLNDGARKEDIAASIFQAVVNQTLGGLACGKPIRGRVAFLGGPLYFLSELRKRFIESLHLMDEEVIIPDNGLLYPAIGAALLAGEKGQKPKYHEGKETSMAKTSCKEKDFNSEEGVSPVEINTMIHEIQALKEMREDIKVLPPLFASEKEYEKFKLRHSQSKMREFDLSSYTGNTFLGIDAGSTTTKVILLGEEDEILYQFYGSNQGEPLKKAAEILKDIYKKLPVGAVIRKSTVTGYGEELLKAAFHVDMGEIETIAHYKAAEYFLPGVDFILDIGGQDMKCLRIKNGTIDSILLNEACSSGCGSFLESFASSMNLDIKEFVKLGLFAKAPVDLGTKCTVFMNSKVKQAQKEGAAIGDLSAGLSYSVVKNAIYKVIKIRGEKDMGRRMIVQGGTFYNDAVLRCFELITEREVVRPEIAGLMGALGAALLAKEKYLADSESKTTLVGEAYLHSFAMDTSYERCKKCTNHCLLTVNVFSIGDTFVSGNRCELGAILPAKTSNYLKISNYKKADTAKEAGEDIFQAAEKLPDLYTYKYQRLFSYTPLKEEEAIRGVIGMPRALNMYENYPFWFAFFTSLGFRVLLSSPSTKKLYERGLETIPSDSVCYPAKLCHGHIFNLMERGINTIFYPSVVYEKREYEDADNHYNCPIVISYSEVTRNNIEEVKGVKYLAPFITMNNDKALEKAMAEALMEYKITVEEIRSAVKTARGELERFKKDIRQKGEDTLKFLAANKKRGIVLCGKPYHLDPEVHHGIPELIRSFGFAVLTEDSISHMAPLKQKLRVVDQWSYNSRIYRAAVKVAEEECLNLIQLNSFGCGLDSVTSDQLIEILAASGKIYTMLKIDEGNNLGAVKIRIRSLKAAIEEREKESYTPFKEVITYNNPIFTNEIRKTHTILAPQMAPIHFELIQEAARACNYRLEILPSADQLAIDEGLKYVNNDVCYPAILLIGQIVHALKSGKYDLYNTSVIISQTGGGCRATNYMSFLKLGLKQAGYENIPLISLNIVGLGEQPGFKISVGFANRLIMSLLYGDLFMKLLYGSRPYEKEKGAAYALYQKWNEVAKENVRNGSKRIFDKNIKNIVQDFDHLTIHNVKKPKVAIVGEILAKYHPMANTEIIKTLEEGGAEVVLPDLMDFFLYSLYNADFKYKYLGGSRLKKRLSELARTYLSYYRKTIHQELQKSRRFSPPASIDILARKASEVLSLGNQTGEGWLITAEMIECIENGIPNILCVQPLACLPNHITGRGMFKPLKDRYPMANIMPIDYDPGISQVNQLNRVKLMLSVALKNNSL